MNVTYPFGDNPIIKKFLEDGMDTLDDEKLYFFSKCRENPDDDKKFFRTLRSASQSKDNINQ